MSKLVRAKVKRVEDLPGWAKCCSEYYKLLSGFGEVIFDLSDTYLPSAHCQRLHCSSCRADHGSDHLGVRNLITGNYNIIECFDLDEGQLAEVSQ